VPADAAERIAIARRVVADRCLYGVDINPMAVEMAKLSLLLVTMDKNRPFTSLDHALKCGDSLLGITTTKDLDWFDIPRCRLITGCLDRIA
jgi:type II restriction/modification system DNA methylase subunit YeeA